MNSQTIRSLVVSIVSKVFNPNKLNTKARLIPAGSIMALILTLGLLLALLGGGERVSSQNAAGLLGLNAAMLGGPVNPGGVTGQSLWVKADLGLQVDASQQVEQWLDQSGSGNTTTQLRASLPTHTDAISPSSAILLVANGINFNPAVDFNGTVGRSLKGNAATEWDATPISIFAVSVLEGAPVGVIGGIFDGLNSWTVDPNAGGMGLISTASSYALDSNGSIVGLTTSPITEPRVVRGIYTNPANTLGGSTWLNGVQEGTGTSAPTSAISLFEVGGRTAGSATFDNRVFNGKITEVVVHKSVLSAANANRIESYLAVKYGITLRQTPAPQNYTASDGSTSFWDAAVNTVYNNNITGIGRDDASGLSQKQSRSVNLLNNGNMVTMGLGTIAADNASNPNTFDSDLNFLTWGDDGAAASFTTPITPPVGVLATFRTTRVWKAQETGTVGTVRVGIPANLGGGNTVYLVVSNDTTFDENDQYVPLTPLTAGGALYQAGDFDLTTGQFFAFATLPGDLEWSCGSNAPGLLFQFDGSQTSLREIDMVTGAFNTTFSMFGRSINANAYNVLDNFVYAWDLSTQQIVRIGGDGSVQDLGVPAGMLPADVTNGFVVGDVDDNGRYWLLRFNPNSWYEVDLVSMTATTGSTTAPVGGGFDWSYVAGTNKLWRVGNDATQAILVGFDRTTHTYTTPVGLGNIAGNQTFGATYADADGFLYASSNDTGAIYRIDVNAGTGTFFSPGPASGSNDGARCAGSAIRTDFGDAPVSYGTLLTNNGARQGIRNFDEIAGTSPLMLGSSLSHETDGQPGQFANGDTDDGVASLAPYLPGGGRVCTGTLGTYTTSPTEYCAVVSVTNTGTDAQVVGWIDDDGSGNFLDAGDRSVPIIHPAVDDGTFTTGNSPAGTTRDIIVVWQGLPSTLPAITYFRFRVTTDASFFSDASPQPIGAVTDGEVEDYVLLSPTAANVSISGRVMTADGRGLPRATVILTDMNGISRTATTSMFGYFVFDGVEVGETYILTAVSKGYQFEQRTISVLDEMSGLDFVALE